MSRRVVPVPCRARAVVLALALGAAALPAAAQEPCKVNPATLWYSPGFAQLVVAPDGRTVHVAGQVAQDSAGQLVGVGDFRQQARQVFANLGLALAAVDADWRHVVKWTIYLTDLAHVPALREERLAVLGSVAPPASTLVQVVSLYRPELLLEIEAVVAAPTALDCRALRARERPAPAR